MNLVLQNFLSKDKIPQSLLLTGSVDISVAKTLARHILGVQHEIEHHPDLHIYYPEEKSDLHPFSSIQDLITETGLPPFQAPHKVFILVGAEKMLTYASNALLKTLEEPSPDTYFILLATKPETLLPTLRSRLYPLAFPTTVTSIDLTSYIEMALKEDFPALFEALPSLEDKDPDALFEAILRWTLSQNKIEQFQEMAMHVAQGQTAYAHNVKLTTILMTLFLKLSV